MPSLSDFFDQEYIDIMMAAMHSYRELAEAKELSDEHIKKVDQITRSVENLPEIFKKLESNKLLKMFIERKMKGLIDD